MNKETLLNGAVAVLTACALVTTVLVVRHELASSRPIIQRGEVVSAWRTYAHDGHRMGSPNAPVTIVVFADFECPYCAALAERIHSVRLDHPNDVAVVNRHFPLKMHRHAIAAVRASECAADQGRFDTFHDAVFAEQDSIATESWHYFARLAQVPDVPAFDECVASTRAISALARDTLAGATLHVTATPTFLINETRLEGAQPLDTLEAYISRLLRARNRSHT